MSIFLNGACTMVISSEVGSYDEYGNLVLGYMTRDNQSQEQNETQEVFIPWDFILVRDSQSKWLLDALEIPSVQVQDIVFLHEPPLPSKPITEHIRPIGISIRGGFLQDENESVIPRMYDYLVKQWFKPIFWCFPQNEKKHRMIPYLFKEWWYEKHLIWQEIYARRLMCILFSILS